MKKLLLSALSLIGLAGIASADVSGPSGRFLQIRNTLQPSSTVYFSSGTVDQSLILNYATPGNCVEVGPNGKLISAAAPCGTGGGGSSSLEVFSTFDAARTSPTASISIGDSLKMTVSGSTAIINVDFSTIPSRGDVILNRNSLQAGTTFFTSSGSVSGQFSPTSIKWPDGTIQVSSPPAGGSGGGGGYAVEPATVTFRLDKGLQASTMTLTTFTPGSVMFVGVSSNVSENNSKFYWDTSNNKLGIGASSALEGMVHIAPNSASVVGQTIKAAVSQSANLIETKNSSGSRRFTVSPAGAVNIMRDSGAFGSGAFSTLVLGDTVAGETVGVTITSARANPANLPLLAFAAYDSGAALAAYYGGGGWSLVNPNEHRFFTSASYGTTAMSGETEVFSVTNNGINSFAAEGYGLYIRHRAQAKGWLLSTLANGANADLYFYEDNGSSYRGGWRAGGTFGVGTGISAHAGQLEVRAVHASTKAFVVQGAAAQTANLQEWQNSSGVTLSSVGASGKITVPELNIPSLASQNCLGTDATGKVQGGSCGGGGGGTTIRYEDGGSFVVNSSTNDFNGDQFVVTNSGGEALVTLNQSSVTVEGKLVAGTNITLTPGAGTLTIASSGGAGDIEGVTAGPGLSGGGTSGTVTLSLDPGATHYIHNQNTLQSGATFYVSSGTVAGPFSVSDNGAGAARLNVHGVLTVDRPDIAVGIGVNRASLEFDPFTSAPTLNIKTHNTSATNSQINFFDSSNNNFGRLNFPPTAGGSFGFAVSSFTTGNLAERWGVVRNTGVHSFFGPDGTTLILSLDPVLISSFTGAVNFASSMTLSGGYRVQNIAPSNGQVLKFDGSNWAPGTDNTGGAGGADNLGDHISTKTITAGFGINATTGTFSKSATVTGTLDTYGVELTTYITRAGYILFYSSNSSNVYNLGLGSFFGLGAGSDNTNIGMAAGEAYHASALALDSNTNVGAFSYAGGNGSYNTNLGAYSNSNGTGGSYNVGVGYFSLRNNTGSRNVSLGSQSMFTGTSADDNTVAGDFAAYYITTGDNNVVMGKSAGGGIVTGSSNTLIGFEANIGADLNKATAIGAGAVATSSNTMMLGSTEKVIIPGSFRISSLNCTGSSNGGALTADANGDITCSDDDAGGGGGGTTIRYEDGGVFVVNSSTNDFNGDQFVVTNSGGEALVTLNQSSVTLQGNTFNTANRLLQLDGSADVPDANLSANVSLLGSQIDISAETNLTASNGITLTDDALTVNWSSAISRSDVSAAYQPLDATLTDLAAAPLSEDNSIAVGAIAAGTLPTDVMASSATLSLFYSDNQVRTNLGLAIGTNVQAWDTDLDDLADGSLTGSKVGSGVPAANIAAGSLGSSVIASSIAVAAVGIAQHSASGTPSATTFLRGDNSWASPAGSGDAVLAATQTWSGGNTFKSSTTLNGPVLDRASGAGTSGQVLASSGPGLGVYWTTVAAGAATFNFTFNAAQANLPGTNAPYISNSTNSASAAVFFDETSTQTVTWSTILSPYNGGTLNADVVFLSSATSGTMNWGVYLECITPNSDAVSADVDSFGTVNSTSVVVGGTSLMSNKATVALSNEDSCAAGDELRVKLERRAQSSDTAVGKGRVRRLRIYE